MEQKVKAVYRSGIFILQEPLDVPDGSEVELTVQGPLILSHQIADPVERSRLLRIVTDRMQQNPIPTGATRLTREELHERSSDYLRSLEDYEDRLARGEIRW